MSTRIFLPTIAIALLATSLSPGYAFETEHHTEAVTYTDLDLTTDAGKWMLLARLEQAAKTVCADPITDRRDLKAVRSFQNCYTAAMAEARDEMNTIIASAQHSLSTASNATGDPAK